MNRDTLLDENQQSIQPGSSSDLRVKARQQKLEKVNKKLNRARIVLYVLAALFGIVTIYEGYQFAGQDPLLFWIVVGLDIFIAVSFLVSAIMFYRNPFGWILFSLILYGTLQLGIILSDPSSAYKGILIKVLVIVFLVKGLQNTKEKKDLEKEIELLELEEISSEEAGTV
ncbi:hypothetical protein [Halocola ammonii]